MQVAKRIAVKRIAVKRIAVMVGSGLAIAPLLLQATSAQAEPANSPQGMSGSYLGVTLDGDNLDDGLRTLVRTGNSAVWLVDQVVGRPRTTAAPGGTAAGLAPTQLQGRIDLPNSQLSVRGTVVMGEQVESITPVLSYDLPVGGNTNVYAGAGYAIVQPGQLVQPGQQAPVGDRDGVVLTTGVETSLSRQVIVYGDMRYQPNTAVGRDAMQWHVGIGHRF